MTESLWRDEKLGTGWHLGLLVLGGALAVLWMVWSAKPAACKRGESNYVGAHRCRGCHAQAYKSWKGSAHAKAFLKLPAKDRKKVACLRCHSTGTSSHLQGVQCESCHGGGKYYVKPEVMVDPLLARTVGLKVTKGASGCTQCHTPQISKKFHYPTQWAKIKHGKK